MTLTAVGLSLTNDFIDMIDHSRETKVEILRISKGGVLKKVCVFDCLRGTQ